jgi:hypothetical protein
MTTEEKQSRFVLTVSETEDVDENIAYLRLPTHPGTEECRMSRSVRLCDVLGPYVGPDVVLDFDEGGVLVGIEVS